jgi:hypothetical protein
MVLLIFETDNIQYNVDVDFEDIDKHIANHRTSATKMSRHNKVFRAYLDQLDRYPEATMLADRSANIIKFYNYMKDHYKLEKTLYKAIIKHCNDRKKLYKIVVNSKSKFQDLFNARLENIEEAMTKEYIDEGQYLYHINGIKKVYDNTMKEFDIFDRINDPDVTLRIA